MIIVKQAAVSDQYTLYMYDSYKVYTHWSKEGVC